MHIFSYDFFFKKRDDSIFSWLPIPTYPKKMVSLKKKLKKKNPSKFGAFWAIFFHPKFLSIHQNYMCQVSKTKFNYQITNCHHLQAIEICCLRTVKIGVGSIQNMGCLKSLICHKVVNIYYFVRV